PGGRAPPACGSGRARGPAPRRSPWSWFSTRAGTGRSSIEGHALDLALRGLLDREQGARREGERTGHEIRGEDLEGRVVDGHGVVVGLSRERDAVLGRDELLLEPGHGAV